MKTIYRYFAVSALFAVSACNLEIELVEEPALVEISAKMEYETETRTSISGLEGEMYYPLWSAEDEIAVYADGDADPSRFSLTSGEGTTEANFTGSRSGKDYIAVYPYDSAGSVSDSILSITLPQTQKYAEASFGQGAYPMIGTGTAKDGLSFKNLCSVMKISFTGTAAIKSVTLTANDENTFLSGQASVSLDYATSGNYLTMSEGGSTSVTLETKGLQISEEAPADAYIVIPAQTYKGGLTIEVDTYTEKITKTISSDLTFERSQIRDVKCFELDSEVPDIIPEAIPDNEIWYTTKDNSLFDWSYYKIVCGEPFDKEIISHTYVNGIGKIVFNGPLTRVNDNAFSSYGNYTDRPKSLTNIYLPNKVEYIGSVAFGNQQEIETFKVPDSKFELRSSAFQGAKVMKFIGKNILPNGEGILVDGVLYALNYDDKAEQLIIPEGVVEIGESLTSGNLYDFCNRPNIKKLVVTEGVRKINDCAFWYCTSLESVSLPSTLEEVGSYIFRFCPNIREFIGDSKFITADNKCFLDIFDECGRWGLGLQSAVKVGLPNDYIIPEGLGSIRPHSFEGIENLHSITLPNSIMMIESSGGIFRDCPNFEFIYGAYASDDNKCAIVHNELWCDGNTLMAFAGKGIKEYTTYDVKRLGDHLFAYQNKLEKIVINDEVSEIGNYCFSYCPNLKSITLPANLEVFRYDPFIGSNNLETIYFRSPLPPKFEVGGIEQSQYTNLTIYVPEQYLQAYLNDASWSPLHKYMKGYQCDDLYYISSDYSKDGVVTTLQTANKGNGIDIVLMGDAYSDRQIADGTYEADILFLYDNLFTEEPYKTYKDMFNVYYVNVVSATEGYGNGGAALGGYFGDGTLVGGNDNAVFNYALNAISEEEMDEALLIVAMNSDNYAGTCYMYYPSSSNDYGCGVSVSYFPKGGDATTFAQLLHHEACGHGFAKLADEYAYEDMGTAPSDDVSEIKSQQANWGWWKNVDFTSDPTATRWSHFVNDTRYANDGLGAYEGGLTYWTGVWRPTENSIMRYNTGGFNAPSREAIYYRIHKLAYGESWEYNYEEFVEYDAVNRKTSESAYAAGFNYVERVYEPTTPPVVVNKSWKDVSSDSSDRQSRLRR